MSDLEALRQQLPYRPCVGIILINRDGLVFIGKRLHSEESIGWQMPQGGIDEGESPQTAALRELFEETGTDAAKIIAESRAWLTYDLPDSLLGKVWKGRYRGQKQKWFAMQFQGSDDDIKLDRCEKPEFSSYRWEQFENLPPLIVPFKRAVYEKLVTEFSPLIARLKTQA